MVGALLWGLLAASSLVLGAGIAALHEPHRRALGLVMGFGAGVLLSAVSFELVEEAADVSAGASALGFFAGALVFLGGDWAIGRLGYRDRKSIAGTAQSASALAIVLGIVLDGLPESAVIGLSLLDSGEVGVSVLVAVFISNVPEAVAATAGLRASGWPLTRVFALWTGTALVCAAASAAGYGLLADASGGAVAFVLAFAGGAILAMLSTTMMPEGFTHAGRTVGLATTFGFALAFGINWVSG
jgi:zinc transporter, ZIP family